MSIYKIEAGTAQHVGSRSRQHDRAALFTAATAPGYVLAVVGDGGPDNALGAEQLLHTARQAVDDLRIAVTPDIARITGLLRDIAQETHELLLMNPLSASSGARSTMALLMLTPAREAVWATVGDTRLYRFTGSACTGRTDDADYIEHLVATDGLPPEAARKHRASRLLNNVLGNKLKAPFVTTGAQRDLQPGDGFMLCTDGLWPWFADNELAAVVSRRTPREAAGLLVEKARERAQDKGDNCTMALIRLVAPAA